MSKVSGESNSGRKSKLNVVIGALTFGRAGVEDARVHKLEDVEAILDVYRSHGYSEVDTARTYSAGSSEEYLGQLDLKSKGFKISTKLYPIKGLHLSFGLGITHAYESMREHLLESLRALKTDSVDVWYLHGPDRSVPYEITMKAVNDLHREGYFKKLGISNYASWEIAEIVSICRTNAYIQPTIYQGLYNVLHRNVEPELIPCLRKFGISLYEFNPLGGGMFTGRYASPDVQVEGGARFDPNKVQGQFYRARYWKDAYFKALSSIRSVAEKHHLTMSEIALRWVCHHSKLSPEHGDAIIIGASSLQHIEENLADLEKEPLPNDILQVLDEAWLTVKPYATNYFHGDSDPSNTTYYNL